LVIKISIVSGAGYFIYNRIANNEQIDFRVFWRFLTENEVFLIKNICFLFIFTIFNWFFEILKWQKLVTFVQSISFYDSLKQCLAALTASLLTPNRIGDYAAKVAYYSSQLRKRVLVLNLISHMAQMTATIVIGLIGLYFFSDQYGLDLPLFRIARVAALVVIILLFTLFSGGKFNYRIKGIQLGKLFSFIKDLPLNLKAGTLILSFIRYLIFSAQFVWLLHLFGVEVSYFQAMVVISTLYLIASLIPTFVLTDVIVKGSIALYLFNIAGVNDLTILSIISLMWILNFALPGIIGSFYVLSYKTVNKLKGHS
ncbi:MAG: hypothetical protein HKO96_03165, partial [Flavobacteriaceae bacterium]|nr:hypothetical protein [Flavobacteriaceae bacterium]